MKAIRLAPLLGFMVTPACMVGVRGEGGSRKTILIPRHRRAGASRRHIGTGGLGGGIGGDGQLACYLATMARMPDFHVTICDPREEFADPFPLADISYIRRMPDDAVRALTRQPRTAVVTLAHDPKQDDPALTAALESDAFYIGALGSARSAAARRERLLGLGFSAGQIARICAPARLPIGSKRPSEIALSILAEITATRNGMVKVKPAGHPKQT